MEGTKCYLQNKIREDWATVIIEYSYSPHWFCAVIDQFNYDNPTVPKNTIKRFAGIIIKETG